MSQKTGISQNLFNLSPKPSSYLRVKKKVIDRLSPARLEVQLNFEQYVDNVFRFALSLSNDWHVAEDLTQECFLRAHQRQEQLQCVTVVKSWLFKILLNLWKDNLKKRHVKTVDKLDIDFVDSIGRPEDNTIQQEACDHIVQQMQALPDQQRNVLFLSAVEQFSNREIAGLIQCSENSVKANLSIARKAMRKKLARHKKQEKSKTE